MEMNMQNELQAMLENIMYIVITGVLPIIAAFITQFLAKARDNVENSTMMAWQKENINRAIEAVSQSVDYTSQTYVAALKHEGNWTPEAQKEAFNITKEKATAFIDSELKELITATYGDFDLWLETKIEQLVAQSK